MSKTYNNCIFISDSAAEVEKKIMNMVTDPARKRLQDKGHPEVCPVCYYQEIFNQEAEEDIRKQCREASIGCVDCKKICIEKVNMFLDPIRKKRDFYKHDSAKVKEILKDGRKKAHNVASETLLKVKDVIGI